MMGKSIRGLTTLQAKELQKKYGLNEYVKSNKLNPIKKFISIFKEPMFLLLIGTGFIYILLGEIQEAFIMMIFVCFVIMITFVQEWRTEKMVDALKALTSPRVSALRDDAVKKIKSCELVPQDIIFLSEGERIPADCAVIDASNFSVDESVLTGESEPVFKSSHADIKASNRKDYWKDDMVYAGTLSLFGKCTAKVVSTGFNTEYGKISKAISETKEEPTPLQKKIHALVKNLAIMGVFLCTAVILLSYMYTHRLIPSILSGITLAMAIIPEEFPVVLTVFLSLGAFRLAKRNALMRKVSAVETLGCATVLAVDKTGTITKNNMEVKKIYTDKIYDADKFSDPSFSDLMVLSCEKDPYDPMEKAIINNSKKNINDISKLYSLKADLKIAFDPAKKRMANVYHTDKGYYAAAKGSPETIIPLCSLSNGKKSEIEDIIDEMAGRGLRVIAFADAYTSELSKDLEDYPLRFKGLIGLLNPPKDGVKEAVNLCKSAGIRVIMITGDYNKTAMAIGNEIGLSLKDCAITGNEIDNMSDSELCEAVKHCDIFSRVIPKHKMRIVKALKANGEIVAMTGDGVNDAPALKNANIGIAMGKRGTEVAKQASHMILMDDNFTTIVSSVKDGRRIFDNIRKAIVYILVIHIPIIALSLFTPVFNLPQILLPVHVVLLELIIDPTCSIIFEAEEAEADIMKRPPKLPSEPLLPKNLTAKVILQGTSMFLASFVPFHYLVDTGTPIDTARSFALLTLIVSNVVLVLVNRTDTQFLWHIFKEGKNNARLLINSLSIIFMLMIIYVPLLNTVFKTGPLSLHMLVISVFTGIISSIWWEIVKLADKL
ncbi:MAG: cation-translocating P-type ATPase [Clostridiales bacterium]|nr:cation-translocating P-type ATPase [Clostridiales bacterium]